MHSDFRLDPFTDSPTSLAITGEVQMIPMTSPYTFRLNEVPAKDTPSTISMRARDNLVVAITSTSATLIYVANVSGISIGDVITIDSEQLMVSNNTSGTLTVIRGYNGTTAATHLINAFVYGPLWAEVATVPAARQYRPDYSTSANGDENWNTGQVQFNSADAGKILSINYNGTGTHASINPAESYPACYHEYGNGNDGHFISSGSDTIDGLRQYKSFVIQAGHDVVVGPAPLTILCQGPVIIAGRIDGSGAPGETRSRLSNGYVAGGAGKGGGGNGGGVDWDYGTSTASSGPGGMSSGAGGGGSLGGIGLLAGAVIAAATSVSSSLANLAARLLSHSAGGGGQGGSSIASVGYGSGGGGGSVMLIGRRIVNTGTITVTAGDAGDVVANNHGGGGGGGASIRIVAPVIKFTGVISAYGGKGGDGQLNGSPTTGGSGWSRVIEIG